uniref:Stanniocalcin n=1 Tax=Hucho hucho TaxID=62062 RepID=A0A4W5NLU3_9TELE
RPALALGNIGSIPAVPALTHSLSLSLSLSLCAALRCAACLNTVYSRVQRVTTDRQRADWLVGPAHFRYNTASLFQSGEKADYNTAEIQHCLVSAGDVGCGVFECFDNNSCEIRGLQEICLTFLHNAGKFDSQVRHSACLCV